MGIAATQRLIGVGLGFARAAALERPSRDHDQPPPRHRHRVLLVVNGRECTLVLLTTLCQERWPLPLGPYSMSRSRSQMSDCRLGARARRPVAGAVPLPTANVTFAALRAVPACPG